MDIAEATRLLCLSKSVEEDLRARGSAPSNLVRDLTEALEFALKAISDQQRTAGGVLDLRTKVLRGLGTLCHNQPSTISEVAEYTRTTGAAVRRIFKDLCDEGLLEKLNKHDYFLTELGRAAIDKAWAE